MQNLQSSYDQFSPALSAGETDEGRRRSPTVPAAFQAPIGLSPGGSAPRPFRCANDHPVGCPHRWGKACECGEDPPLPDKFRKRGRVEYRSCSELEQMMRQPAPGAYVPSGIPTTAYLALHPPLRSYDDVNVPEPVNQGRSRPVTVAEYDGDTEGSEKATPSRWLSNNSELFPQIDFLIGGSWHVHDLPKDCRSGPKPRGVTDPATILDRIEELQDGFSLPVMLAGKQRSLEHHELTRIVKTITTGDDAVNIAALSGLIGKSRRTIERMRKAELSHIPVRGGELFLTHSAACKHFESDYATRQDTDAIQLRLARIEKMQREILRAALGVAVTPPGKS